MVVFTLNLIIDSTHLLLELLTEDSLNIIIIMMGSTITVMVITKVARKTCNKYKWNIIGMGYIMKISECIKSRIKFDTDHKLTSGRHRTHLTQKNHRRGCNRYLTPKRRGHNIRIGNKCPSSIQRPKVTCTAFPFLSPDKRSNIR